MKETTHYFQANEYKRPVPPTVEPEWHGVPDPIVEKIPEAPHVRINIYSEELADAIGETGRKLVIPQKHMYGIQEKNEYSRSKEKKLREAFRTQGKAFLEENPIYTCAVPSEKGMQLAVIDGHHRARYAPKYGIREIPTIVLTVEELTDILNKNNMNKTGRPYIFADELESYLIDNMRKTEVSFFRGEQQRSMPQTIDIAEGSTVDDLEKKFNTFGSDHNITSFEHVIFMHTAA